MLYIMIILMVLNINNSSNTSVMGYAV